MDVSACSCDAPSVPPKLPADPALGQAIRRLRERRGLTQEELATHAGMTFGTVSRLESAKSAPAWATVRALVTTLRYSITELATEIEVCERTKQPTKEI
jgi:transcriptional regulator with XRE-family HTH domain